MASPAQRSMSSGSMPAGSMGRFVRPSMPPVDGQPAIDMAHLSRQSLGDAKLEMELLTLFDIQAGRIASDMGMPDLSKDVRAERLDLAHTLKGSARAVGATRVGAACEALESLLRAHAPQTSVDVALREVRMAVHAAREFIAAAR